LKASEKRLIDGFGAFTIILNEEKALFIIRMTKWKISLSSEMIQTFVIVSTGKGLVSKGLQGGAERSDTIFLPAVSHSAASFVG
jgi:hypothetical protein